MMLATALRKSILQAAIAGELTEQRADDGDARDLLTAIRKEKTRLVRAGKLKKERALPEIREDEVPFEVPENWCWARLGDITFFITDGTHQRPDYTTVGIPFVSVKDISDGRLSFEQAKRISPASHKELTKRCAPEYGDILITKVGTTGIPVLVDTHEPFSLFVSVALIKFPHNLINPGFLAMMLSAPVVQKQASENTRGVGNKNWVLRDIKNTIVPLPPYQEQLRIVASLEKFAPELAKLETDEHELDALTSAFPARMKSSLLLAAMRGELTEREPDDGDARDLLKTIEREKKRLIKEKRLKREKPLPPVAEEDVPFEIPETWCWCRLGDVAIFQNGDRGKNYPKRTEYTTRGIPWVNAGHITADGFLSETSMNFISIDKYQELRNGKFQRGDLVYCLRGTLGKVGRIEPYSEGAVASSLMIIRPMVPNVYFREYIFHYLKSALARRQLLQFDNGSAQPNLAAKDVAKYLIPLPPLAEQRRIVARLEELLGAVENG